MAIPVGGTRITVRRRAAQQEPDDSPPFIEPAALAYHTVASGVAATIGTARGTEDTTEGNLGAQAHLRFIADPCGIQAADVVEDERAATAYEVVWVGRRVSLLGELREEGALVLYQGPQYSTT